MRSPPETASFTNLVRRTLSRIRRCLSTMVRLLILLLSLHFVHPSYSPWLSPLWAFYGLAAAPQSFRIFLSANNGVGDVLVDCWRWRSLTSCLLQVRYVLCCCNCSFLFVISILTKSSSSPAFLSLPFSIGVFLLPQPSFRHTPSSNAVLPLLSALSDRLIVASTASFAAPFFHDSILSSAPFFHDSILSFFAAHPINSFCSFATRFASILLCLYRKSYCCKS
jgi:hypothetical protein